MKRANILVLCAGAIAYAAIAHAQIPRMDPKRYEIPALTPSERGQALDAIARAKPGSPQRQELADQLCRRILGSGVIAHFTAGDDLVCRPLPPTPRKDATV